MIFTKAFDELCLSLYEKIVISQCTLLKRNEDYVIVI